MQSIEIHVRPGMQVAVRAVSADRLAQITIGDPHGQFEYTRPPLGELMDLGRILPLGRTDIHLQVVNDDRGPWHGTFEVFVNGRPVQGSPFHRSGDDWLLQRVHAIAHLVFFSR